MADCGVGVVLRGMDVVKFSGLCIGSIRALALDSATSTLCATATPSEACVTYHLRTVLGRLVSDSVYLNNHAA
jgi:hypothetical protein